MIRTTEMIQALKKQLKQAGVTYAQLATGLEMSEANVKRMFSQGNMTLQRMEKICDLLQLDFLQLAQFANKQRSQVTELKLEQEEELVANKKLLLLAQLLLSRWTLEEVQEVYEFEEHELTQLLAKLDRIRFIELLPGNRVKLLVSSFFKWQPNGPVQRFFEQNIQVEFFRSRFNDETEKLIFISGMLSRGSNRKIQDKMTEIASEFERCLQEDMIYPAKEKDGCSLVMGIRSWEIKAFDDFRRKNTRK
ncbi:helix-turn-helix domain-containing protein [Pleionea sediminis]|uniref:helix-turn-helix domain-containing protein n=1 Tax=Pleionea sediminis TaxID=2569479 RepID=UPI001186C2D8|nr:helix-turn-helix domain-containing protein [Pleionea sediminis]